MSEPTVLLLLMTRDTVPTDTFAIRATSLTVGRAGCEPRETALADLICFFGMLTAQEGDCAIYHGHGLLSAFSRNRRELGEVFNETFH
jgi:hypothetical protein